MNTLININNLNLTYSQHTIFNNLSLSINYGQNILITGGLGCGKTTLGKLISNNQSTAIKTSYQENNKFLPKTKFISDFYKFKNKVGLSEFYYQQRYNSETSEDAVTVYEMIANYSDNQEQINKLINLFNISHIKSSSLVQLSSGERKKIQLIIALLEPTQIMIFDNPYIGLDIDSSKNLDHYFNELINEGMSIIIIGDDEYIPSFITHIAIIKNKQMELSESTNYLKQELKINTIDTIIPPCETFSDPNIIKLTNVNITYHNKAILKNINWTIKQGEKWLLRGHNGAGKTTLLSLICGDNPQAYANQIELFGKLRGSGESIWQIKQKIGYISPELQWNFVTHNNVMEVIISGYYDTMGLFRSAREQEKNEAMRWLKTVNLEQYANMQFSQLSMGISRMVLLLRALIKNPPLLIFDEPCQGLDNQSTKIFTQLVDNLFQHSNHSIIYISHRLDQIPKCINHRLTIEKGQVIPNS